MKSLITLPPLTHEGRVGERLDINFSYHLSFPLFGVRYSDMMTEAITKYPSLQGESQG